MIILKELLEEEGSLQKILFKRYKQLLSIRITEEAFNPFGKYEFLDLGSKVFAIKRYAATMKTNLFSRYLTLQERVWK